MTRRLLLVLGALGAWGQTVDRSKPPETPPLGDVSLPPVHETKLPNGLRMVLVEDKRIPLVTLRLGFEAGSKFDPAELSGLAETAAALLTEGTANRSDLQIAEQVAAIGGTLNASAGPDTLIVSGDALAENLPKLLDLAADVARRASFPVAELKLRQQNRIQELTVERSQSDTVGRETIASVLYGAHPYARILPSTESIQRIDVKALTAFRDQYLVPNNAVLVLVGALPAREQAFKLVTASLGDWAQKKLPAAAAPKLPEAKRTIVLVDRPGSVQADVFVGQLAPTRKDPAYFPMTVANNVLGGGASSRMFVNIREKQGFAYDAHSEYQNQFEASALMAVTQVRNDVMQPAMQAAYKQLSGMAAARVAAPELSDVKNYLSGNFVLGLERQGGLASQLLNARLAGLPADYLQTWVTKIRSVEPDRLQAAARQYLAPEDAAIVVVGDASKIQKELEKFGTVKVEKAKE